MKKEIFGIVVLTIVLAACNNADNKTAEQKSAQPTSGEIDKKMAEVTSKTTDTTKSNAAVSIKYREVAAIHKSITIHILRSISLII